MKNTKTKIILSAIVFLSVIGFVGTVSAVGPSLYVSPASIIKTAGDTFSVSVGFNASGSKVCAVEGTLVFNNLSCQSITVSGDIDIVAQSFPTCSNPHFLIGIQNCTTSGRVLLTASVKAGSAGTASISLIGVDIIGEGASVGSASISGNYTINAVPAPATTPPVETPTETPAETPKEETTLPEEQPAQPEQLAVTENIPSPSFFASVMNILSLGTQKTLVTVIVLIIIVAIIIYLIFLLIKRKKRIKNPQS